LATVGDAKPKLEQFARPKAGSPCLSAGSA
jgi:hypothetical protein